MSGAGDESDWQDAGFTLKDRLKTIFETKFMADLKFAVGKNEEEISAHRLVVALASPILTGMIRTLPLDAGISVVDTTPLIFSVFLEYLYTGEIPLSRVHVVQMLHVWQLAKRFGVEELEGVCRDFLQQELTPEHALNVLRHSVAVENGEVVKMCLGMLPETEEKRVSVLEFLNSKQAYGLTLEQKFLDINIHEEIVSDCEMQFQANKGVFVAGFGVFAQKGGEAVGILSLERLDVRKWDWVDHKFITSYTIVQRCEHYGQEVVFFRISPPIWAEQKATYRLIFRESDCLLRISGQEKIKENRLMDFRTKYEQFTGNPMPFLLTESAKMERKALKELTGNAKC